tara:strand:- start:2254 stop:2598 length:345 start_codon:yes stop_codon:yes gene_type:complete
MDASRGFVAQEAPLEFRNSMALLNLAFTIVYDDDDETAFDFFGYASAYFRVYDERGGQLIKNFSAQVTVSLNVMILNCSVLDMTFEDLGKYYFEMGYNRSGYEIPIRYGELTIS